ncbi:MAG TPA: tannase/feruloyl esterase family alpha/beta hydrolase [Candidatus Acidoferrales bacterium]|nr:tannase/feruloyl esterase family alpha/beta hydrolase [Candidatus Acidoferrales bacterium]
MRPGNFAQFQWRYSNQKVVMVKMMTMKSLKYLGRGLMIIYYSVAAWPCLAQAQQACEKLKDLKLADTSVLSAESVLAGPFALPPGLPAASVDVPAFCRVGGEIKPTPDSHINFEVWLPAKWNGKLEQVGNGGLAGSINLFVLAAEMKKGFASAGTDDGHQGSPVDGSWVIGHPEKVKDFGYRAVHETNERAKQIIAAFYQKAPKYSYFNGCSEGGREAMMEAQRYPEDFDGILAGAAANKWTDLMAAFAWNAQALNSAASFISPAKRTAIRETALAACGSQDGVKDAYIKDPLICHFDPSVLLCKDSESDSCLTAEQLAALKKIYSGPKNPRTQKQIASGYEPGAEGVSGVPGIAFDSYVYGAAPGASLDAIFSSAFYGGFVFENPNWKFSDLNFDKDMLTAQEKIGPSLNANNPVLSAFLAHGGKLIQYHGWNDGSPSPHHAIEYYEDVMAKMGGFTETSKFYRLFMVPGMMHCGSGPGPNLFGNMLDFAAPNDSDHNIFSALERWTEQGVAPDRIVATKYTNDDPTKGVEMTRPLCPYPQIAKWTGKGTASDAQSWVCQTPVRK